MNPRSASLPRLALERQAGRAGEQGAGALWGVLPCLLEGSLRLPEAEKALVAMAAPRSLESEWRRGDEVEGEEGRGASFPPPLWWAGCLRHPPTHPRARLPACPLPCNVVTCMHVCSLCREPYKLTLTLYPWPMRREPPFGALSTAAQPICPTPECCCFYVHFLPCYLLARRVVCLMRPAAAAARALLILALAPLIGTFA